MKFTPSKDGVERATIHIKQRYDRDSLCELAKVASWNGLSLNQFLVGCLENGVQDAVRAYEEVKRDEGMSVE